MHALRTLGLTAGLIAALGVADQAGALEMTEDGPVIVFGGRQPVPNLDPSQKYDWSTRMMQQALYDALVKYVGDPPEIVPWLAKEWEVNDDAAVWTFHLDERAVFHDGSPVDAEAVKFSFERTLEIGQGPAWMLNDFLSKDGIEVVDEHTIRFTLSQPYAPFLSFLPWWYIMNPDVVMANEVDGDLGRQWLTENAAGSGPFRIERWEQGSLYELETVDDYWKGWPNDNPPAGVIYRLIREAATQRAALQRGDADIVEGLSSEDFDIVAEMPGIVVENHPGMTTFGFKFNTQRPPTDDINLRKAIAYAFDYDAFIDIYNGNAVLQDSPFPYAIRGHKTVEDMPRQDLDKAREYLAKSDYAEGDLEIEYVYVEGLEEERKMGLVLIDNLQELGIEVSMVPLTWPNMVARAEDVDRSPDMMAVFTTPVSTDPDAVAYQYHEDSWGAYYGSHYLKDEELWAKIEEARSIPEWEEREPIYDWIQERLVELQPEVFGMLANRRWAMRDYIKGFQFSPVRFTGEVDLYTLYVEE